MEAGPIRVTRNANIEDHVNKMTPTTTCTITLVSHYGKTANVRANRWPNGDCWISARQMRNATKRAGVVGGDWLTHFAQDGAGDYLVATA